MLIEIDESDLLVSSIPLPACPGCRMVKNEWPGEGYTHDGETYCCQGCAEGTGCMCLAVGNWGFSRLGQRLTRAEPRLGEQRGGSPRIGGGAGIGTMVERKVALEAGAVPVPPDPARTGSGRDRIPGLASLAAHLALLSSSPGRAVAAARPHGAGALEGRRGDASRGGTAGRGKRAARLAVPGKELIEDG